MDQLSIFAMRLIPQYLLDIKMAVEGKSIPNLNGSEAGNTPPTRGRGFRGGRGMRGGRGGRGRGDFSERGAPNNRGGNSSFFPGGDRKRDHYESNMLVHK